MAITLQKSEDRGGTPQGWLTPRFSFSFANYYNPKRMGFGALRVLNDDIIAPSAGFGTHPHDNMEIITIPLSGNLAHKDSTGKEGLLEPGTIQVMSAGTGVLHSEYNASSQEPLNLFQLWITPHTQNVSPRYDEKTFSFEQDTLTLVVSGEENEQSLFIHQDAKIYYGKFTAKKELSYDLAEKRGIFLIVIHGTVTVAEQTLHKRDSIEITEMNEIPLKTETATEFLLIEVPVE